jgi:glycine oxidase
MDAPRSPDVVIAGAGIIGLALALELDRRGARVTVLERGHAMQQASAAAAGMLAAEDPHNPPALLPFSRWSVHLYPEFLQRIQALSGQAVPWHTTVTVQSLAGGGNVRLAENSLDPRRLAPAMTAAVRASSICLCEETDLLSAKSRPGSMLLRTSRSELLAPKLVWTTGAWLSPWVRPVKGQMLRVQLPATLPQREVYRSESAYVVPRTVGPQAGTALLGASMEEAGFDLRTHAADLDRLRALAAQLVPSLCSAEDCPMLEAWAGLRPATLDGLPVMGAVSPGGAEFLAGGHFRNGILLAPATAMAMADCIEGREPGVDLAAFSTERFKQHELPRSSADIRPNGMTTAEPLAHNQSC